MHIRHETNQDIGAVRTLNIKAFDTPSEADLVDSLRGNVQPLISLVAEQDQHILGHIMFSPVTLSGHPGLNMMGLGPMAVAPPHQRKGIGSQLVHAGLEQCRKLGCIVVVVLGHPEFYPRFGFVPSTRYNN